jgi:hypothetical protein
MDFDDQEAPMEPHQPSSSSRPDHRAGAAQLAEALVLKFQTAGSANIAYLEQDGSGRVYLYFRGLHFDVDDYVPDSLAGSRSRSPCGTAGQFICRQMLTHYGYHEDGWPALARQFILQPTASVRAGRSQSER